MLCCSDYFSLLAQVKFRRGCARKSLGVWNCCLFNILPKSSFSCCTHCVKNVRIRSYSDPYSVRMRENTDQNSSEYGHFLRSNWFLFIITSKQIWQKKMTEEIQGFAVAFSITFSLSSSNVCSGFCLFFCQNVILMAKTFSRRFQVVILILSITLKLQQLHCSSSCCLFLLHIKKMNSVFVDEISEIWNFFLPKHFNHSSCSAVLFVFCSRL